MRALKCAETCSGDCSFSPGHERRAREPRAELEGGAQRRDLRRTHARHAAQLRVARARERVERAEALEQRVRDAAATSRRAPPVRTSSAISSVTRERLRALAVQPLARPLEARIERHVVRLLGRGEERAGRHDPVS